MCKFERRKPYLVSRVLNLGSHGHRMHTMTANHCGLVYLLHGMAANRCGQKYEGRDTCFTTRITTVLLRRESPCQDMYVHLFI